MRRQTEVYSNLSLAFNTLKKEYGIQQLIDPADMLVGAPDEHMISLYLSVVFRTLIAAHPDIWVNVC